MGCRASVGSIYHGPRQQGVPYLESGTDRSGSDRHIDRRLCCSALRCSAPIARGVPSTQLAHIEKDTSTYGAGQSEEPFRRVIRPGKVARPKQVVIAPAFGGGRRVAADALTLA